MDDPNFESLLSLEDTYYEQAFEQGITEGRRQSRLESRLFGVEKAVEKFTQLGILQAQADLWAARTRQEAEDPPKRVVTSPNVSVSIIATDREQFTPTLPSLPRRERILKQIELLRALVDTSELSFNNSNEAVSALDDRLKRAQTKAKLLEKLFGEENWRAASSNRPGAQDGAEKSGNIEDFAY